MSDLKTQPNDTSIDDFLTNVSDEQKRKDCCTIIDMMKSVTGSEPKMWGGSIIGFGTYHYKYASGREGDFFLTGFAPRKQNLTMYIMSGFKEYDKLMSKLGKYKTGRSCLYIKNLEAIDMKILKELVQKSAKAIAEKKWP